MKMATSILVKSTYFSLDYLTKTFDTLDEPIKKLYNNIVKSKIEELENQVYIGFGVKFLDKG